MARRLQRALERAEALSGSGIALEIRSQPIAVSADPAEPQAWLASAVVRVAALIGADESDPPAAARACG
jgi:hypothetical protein